MIECETVVRFLFQATAGASEWHFDFVELGDEKYCILLLINQLIKSILLFVDIHFYRIAIFMFSPGPQYECWPSQDAAT